MFDKSIHIHQRSGPIYSTVTEKRAPTDESVKLLREMEQSAKTEIEKTLRLDNNVISAVLCRLSSIEWGERSIRIYIKINGQKFEVTSSTPEYFTPEERVKKLAEDVSQKLAEEIVKKSFEESAAHLREILE